MGSNPVSVIHIAENKKGGVLEYISTIQKTSSLNHSVIVLGKSNEIQVSELKAKIIYTDSFQNIHATSRKLTHALKGCVDVVCHSELGLKLLALSNIYQNITYVLHGNYEYYISAAIKYKPIISKFICVSRDIHTQLLQLFKKSKKTIEYIPQIVENIHQIEYLENNDNLEILFVGRRTTEKGYEKLINIDSHFSKNNVRCRFHIYGNGSEKYIYLQNDSVHYGHEEHSILLKRLNRFKFIVSPSQFEGNPISVIEAMKNGVVPICSELGEEQFQLLNNKSGVILKSSNGQDYAIAIMEIWKNKNLYQEMSDNAKVRSNKFHDKFTTVEKFDSIIKNDTSNYISNISLKLNTLDKKYIPNIATIILRKLFYNIRNIRIQ